MDHWRGRSPTISHVFPALRAGGPEPVSVAVGAAWVDATAQASHRRTYRDVTVSSIYGVPLPGKRKPGKRVGLGVRRGSIRQLLHPSPFFLAAPFIPHEAGLACDHFDRRGDCVVVSCAVGRMGVGDRLTSRRRGFRAVHHGTLVSSGEGTSAPPALTWDPREGSHRAWSGAGGNLPDSRTSVRAPAPGHGGWCTGALTSTTLYFSAISRAGMTGAVRMPGS